MLVGTWYYFILLPNSHRNDEELQTLNTEILAMDKNLTILTFNQKSFEKNPFMYHWRYIEQIYIQEIGHLKSSKCMFINDL